MKSSIISHIAALPALRQRLENLLPGMLVLEDFAVEHDSPAIGQRRFLGARVIVGKLRKLELILLSMGLLA